MSGPLHIKTAVPALVSERFTGYNRDLLARKQSTRIVIGSGPDAAVVEGEGTGEAQRRGLEAAHD
jgi:hypothetical protein